MRSVIQRQSAVMFLSLTTLIIGQQAGFAQAVFSTVKDAAADPDFVIQGEYVGPNVGVQVVALG